MGILFATNHGGTGGGGTVGPPGLNWLGPWSNATTYAVDDAVSFAGSSYVCIQAHTNQSPPNGTYWNVLAGKGDAGPDAIVWRGPWSSGDTYEVNDVVQLNGSAYICILDHTNQTPPNATYWNLMVARGATGPAGSNAFNWRGPWDTNTDYDVNDVVQRNGSSYVAIVDNQGSAPPSANWQLMASIGQTGATGSEGDPGEDGDTGPVGINWTGDWSSGTTYAVRDAVAYNGSSYYCIQAHTNHTPPNGTYWNLLASKGDQGSDPINLELPNASGASLVFGNVVYVKSDGTGFDKAKANGYGIGLAVGMVTNATVSNGSNTNVQTHGIITGTELEWSAITTDGPLQPGKEYYLDRTTAGKMTVTPTAVLGDVVVPLGLCLTTTKFFLRVQRPIVL